MMKKIFKSKLLNSSPMESVLAAGIVLTFAQGASNILGLFRDRFLASTFGAGDTLDIYYAAFRIPDLIYSMLIAGALSAAFIPVLAGLMSDKEKTGEAWRLVSDMMNLVMFFIILVSLVLAVLAPWMMKLIVPGFPPEKIADATLFTRIMFLSPLFLGISGIMGGVLTSMRHFLVYSVAPLFYNAGIIFGILVFVRIMGPIGLAWGVVLGAFLHMMLQYSTVRKLGYRHHWAFWSSLKNENVKKVLKLMFPRMAGISINQLNLLIQTGFASTLAAGSLAVLTFSQNLQSFIFTVFGISFAVAAFPTLSSFAAQGEKHKFVKVFSETFRQILFFVIPLSVFMIVLRAQIVRVVLGSGKFNWNDTILTFQCLGIFALSLFAQSVVQLLVRSFYALQDTKTPFYIAIATETVSILSVILLIHRVQVLSLAIAFSISSVVQMLLLLFVLRTRFDNLDDVKIIQSISKIALASFVAGLGIQFVKYIVASLVELDTFIGVFMQLTIPLTVGCLIFIGISYFLELEEFFAFRDSFTRKIFRNKQAIQENTAQVGGI